MPNDRNVSYNKDFRPFTLFKATLVEGRAQGCVNTPQVNHSINPSFRRKPESRTLGSRHILSP